MSAAAALARSSASLRVLGLAGATHGLVLFATSLLRPVRDAMGVTSGVERLPWLFTATLVALVALVPLHGWAARRLARAALVPAIWLGAAALLTGFRVAFALRPESRFAASAFFVAAAALNLIVVSSFWSQLADLVAAAAGRRLFGAVAACGTAGALAGPAAAALLAPTLGAPDLLLLAAGALALAAAAAIAQRRNAAAESVKAPARAPIGGALWVGARLALASPRLRLLALAVAAYATVSTYFYLTQSSLVAASIGDGGERTAYFARVDLAVNAGALLLQLLVTPLVALRLGTAALLAAVPAALALALPFTSGRTSLALVSTLYVIHRAAGFAFFRPGRELLATRFALAERFQAKSFLDTAVYRTSDAVAAWLVAALGALGPSAPTLGVALVALAWAAAGLRLGRSFDHESSARRNDSPSARACSRDELLRSTDPT